MLYLFIFGNTPELSALELKSVVRSWGIKYLPVCQNNFGVVAQISGVLDSPKLISRLGGTVKIARVIDLLELGAIPSSVSRSLGNRTKVNFGLSYYGKILGRQDLEDISKDVKNYLSTTGMKIRYILPRGKPMLSSVVVSKQNIQESIIFDFPNTSKFYFAKTVAVFDFGDWNKRDYGRPRVNPKAGMLPPRLARMMVNLASPLSLNQVKLLDPFCGVGTILMEAMMVGFKVVGADVQKNQLEKAEENLYWLKKEYSLETEFRLINADATSISQVLEAGSIDSVVTEPYLGPAEESVLEQKLEGIQDYLEGLYEDSLADWRKILANRGKVAIVIPSFALGHQGFGEKKDLLSRVIDKAQIMGYSLTNKPIGYSRPQARIKRNICLFQYGTP